MTPDCLADLIPINLAKLSPPKIESSSGNPISLCNWLNNFTADTRQADGDFPLGSLWPQPPRINANHYTLSQAPVLPILYTSDCGPVQFCNLPGVNPTGDTVPTLAQCERICDHVIAHNGEVAFTRIDFTLPGPILFKWQRYYRHGSSEDSGLGDGWRHNFSERLHIAEVTTDASGAKKTIAELYTAEGRRVSFTVPAIGHSTYNRFERLLLHRQSLHSYRLCGFDQPDRIFRADGTSDALPLVEVRDRFGSSLTVDYADGLLRKVVSSWGRVLEFHYRDQHIEKILQRDGPTEDQVLCSYDYDVPHKRLSAAYQGVACEQYQYDEQRIVAIDNSQSGQIEFFYDQRQCCQTIRRNNLTFTLSWRQSQRCCTLKMPDRLPIRLKFDRFGQLLLEQQGDRSTSYFYDHYGNLCHKNSNGTRNIYRHDEFGRLVRRTRGGTSDRYVYDDCGRLRAAQLYGEQSWKYRYGAAALPEQVFDPEGHCWQLRYNERGQLSRLTDPEGGTAEFHWDDQAQLTAVQRGDRRWEFAYDHWQRLTAWTRNGQLEKQWHYGSGGVLLAHHQGPWKLQFERDSVGRPCGISQDGQAKLSWQLDVAGNIRQLHLPGGAEFTIHWNAHDRIIQATSADNTFEWHYDGFGQLSRYTDAYGDRIQWQYDNSGRVCEFRDNDSHWFFLHSQSGVLRQIRNNSGQQCEFHFDSSARLVQAANSHSRVRFQYDRRNLLTAEHHDSGDSESLSVSHRYDGRGWLKRSTSEKLDLCYLLSPDACLYGIDANGEAALRCEYAGAEEIWTQGRTRSGLLYAHGQLTDIETAQKQRWRFAPCAPLSEFVPAPAPVLGSGHTERDMRGNIVRERRQDQAGDEFLYQYDGWGLLSSAECGDFKTFFRYDPFGRRLSKLSSHRKSAHQCRMDYLWCSTGLWCEHSLAVDEERPAVHYLYHPLRGTLLGRWQSDRLAHYLLDPAGAPLLLFDELGEILWAKEATQPQATTNGPHRSGGDTWHSSGQMADCETGLHYSWRGYWQPQLNCWLHKEEPFSSDRHRALSGAEHSQLHETAEPA
ncbi:DUF6531 domain-containing protein [Microbulbifer marinus]|uniref:YD repeat-containing protein n=1 Tax=Microbulbifer marinus TaxID=658218 RepID=A0A1H3ZII7_9GAMM|nr:DUF6531 domain-containing protein [Microbulbifer marinus]SEA23221.1 YD repeat-containing protein [Microbulbifer marinus]